MGSPDSLMTSHLINFTPIEFTWHILRTWLSLKAKTLDTITPFHFWFMSALPHTMKKCHLHPWNYKHHSKYCSRQLSLCRKKWGKCKIQTTTSLLVPAYLADCLLFFGCITLCWTNKTSLHHMGLQPLIIQAGPCEKLKLRQKLICLPGFGDNSSFWPLITHFNRQWLSAVV